MADIHMDLRIDKARYLMNFIIQDVGHYSDDELRAIKNTAEAFAVHIRMELAARDARMVDEACALPGKTNETP